MAKQISQETYDAVVKENIDDFEMSAEDAIADAISQFEAQGVNLANIVKDLALGQTESGLPAQHPSVEATENLKQELKSNSPREEIIKDNLLKLQTECDIDLAHRCLAGKNSAYPVLYDLLDKYQSSSTLLEPILSTIVSLFNGQPDLLDLRGMSLVKQVLTDRRSDPTIAALLVKLIRLTCVMHEHNRQAYINGGLIPILMSTMEQHKTNAEVVREVCFGIRVLTNDDDPRVPFGKAHDHAKMIVTEADALRKLLEVSKDYIEDTAVLGELFLTLSRLAVRNEFCQEIMDRGGLELMLGALEKNMDHQHIVSQALIVLKTIAGNDAVKIAIVKSNGVELILACMNKHIRNAFVCETGCAALATLALRNPDHCACIVQFSGPEIICKTMQIHPAKAMLQKQACMAIRNCVARTRQYCDAFLEHGAEAIINTAMNTHQEELLDEAKAALRDLDCKVVLQERWKGTGAGIHA